MRTEKHTPPKPIEAAVPRAVSEDWTGDTDAHEVISNQTDDTPVRGVEAVNPAELGLRAAQADVQATQRLRARVKETNQAVRQIAETTTTTHTGIDTLRKETEAHVARLETKITAVDEKVDQGFEKVTDKLSEQSDAMLKMASSVGDLKEVKGQFTEYMKTADQRRQHEIMTFGSRLQISTQEQIVEIKDEADEAKTKRMLEADRIKKRNAVIYKLLLIPGTIAVALVTHFIEKC